MKFKINRELVPIKAHFFFFFAALGPVLPQLNVFGRQLGVSPAAMGLVTAVLPLLWALAKPSFGYVVDYWPAHRKLVFMLLIALMTGSYCCLWFLPMPAAPNIPEHEPNILEYVYRLNDTIYLKKLDVSLQNLEKFTCHWNCSQDDKFDVYLTNSTYVNTIYVDGNVGNSSCSLFHMDLDDVREGEVVCVPMVGCNLLCYEDDILGDEIRNNSSKRRKRAITDDNSTSNNHVSKDIDKTIVDSNSLDELNKNVVKTKTNDSRTTTETNDVHVTSDNQSIDNHIAVDITRNTISAKDVRSKVKLPPRSTEDVLVEENGSFYMTAAFWGFVVLMCVGTVAFNVANCIGDAVCFDVLGSDGGPKYGAQRAWGTAGYGLTALAGGWLVDAVSGRHKDFTPAFLIALGATAVDLYSCRKLTLPSLSSPSDSGKALREVLKIPRVLLFITFAVVAGTFDSFIIYYMFWFLEEIAEATGYTARIKFIEGVVVAAESFIGELLFFFFSGKIIKRWGYGVTLTFSLCCYGVRMALISLITDPWHLVFIEGIMQGPTYALCYSSIVGYAAHVAPAGYSATVQGIVAGMDDGLGFAIGSLLGGQLYAWLGGRGAFRLFACVAVAGAALHAALYALVTRTNDQKPEAAIALEEDEKMLPELHTTVVYQDTVEPEKDGR